MTVELRKQMKTLERTKSTACALTKIEEAKLWLDSAMEECQEEIDFKARVAAERAAQSAPEAAPSPVAQVMSEEVPLATDSAA